MSLARGFSLIELVVVLVLAGILAALAIPRFTSTESSATWYAEQVKAAARYAQRQAVAQRRNVYVRVQSNEVDICYDSGCTTPASFLSLPGTTSAYILPTPSGVTLTAMTFWFNSLGQPSGTLPSNIAGHPITVEVETGYVH